MYVPATSRVVLSASPRAADAEPIHTVSRSSKSNAPSWGNTWLPRAPMPVMASRLNGPKSLTSRPTNPPWGRRSRSHTISVKRRGMMNRPPPSRRGPSSTRA